MALTDSSEHLSAVDVLNLAVILALTIVVAFFRPQLGDVSASLMGVLGSLLLYLVLAAFLSTRNAWWRIIHDFSAVVVIIVVFNILGPVIDCASPTRWDPTFERLDAALFGQLAAQWRNVLGRPAWLTDLVYLAYVAYYLVPVVLAAILYRRRSLADFRQMVFCVALTFYASYVGYFMFPTLGPRVPQEVQAAVLGGGTVSDAVRAFLDFAERTRTDAFPSGHAAVALMCLYFAWHFSASIFAAVAVVVAGIIFSTVYLHYHYVVDVLAGGALACGCVWLGPRLRPLMEPDEVMKWFTVRLGRE